MNATLQKPPTGKVTNCHNQTVHRDARVLINDGERFTAYKGARFIDAETFVKNHPAKYLTETFTVGIYAYNESLLDTDAGIVMDVPTCYALNGWA